MRKSIGCLTALCLSTSAMVQALTHDPSGCPEIGLTFSMEYLYWKAQEGNLYPVIFSPQSVTNGVNLTDLEIKNQKFDYSSGLRASVGYIFPCENYDVQFAWTYLNPNTTSFYSSSDPHVIIAIPFFDQTDSDVPHAGSIKSHWNLNYNLLDLELGREITFGYGFTVRPHIGLKGGWIDQTQKMNVGDISLGQPTVETVDGTVDRKNNFYGIGPRIGLDLRYALSSHFGLFSTFSGSLLYGKFDSKTVTFLSDTLDNNNVPGNGPMITTLTNPKYNLTPIIQIMLGADWAQSINQFYWIRIGVAYEVQFWWDQMNSLNSIPQVLFVNSPPNANLMMHGLTVQATFEF